MSFPAPPGSAPPQPPQFQVVIPEKQPIGAAKAFLVFGVYVLSQIFAGLVGIAAYALLYGMDSMNALDQLDPILILMSGTAIFVLGGPAILLVTRAISPGRTLREAVAPLGWIKASPAALAGAAVLGVGTALFMGYGIEWVFPTGEPVQGPLLQAALAPGWQRILFVLLAVVLAPVVEEFLFRGVMFSGMARSWGTWPAAIVVTLLFGFLHIFDVGGYYPALIMVTVAGLGMVLLRMKTGSILPSIAMHCAFNGVQVLMLYLFIA